MTNDQQGIVATNVYGQAIAVGSNAQATSYGNAVQGADIGGAVAALRTALGGLDLTEAQHASVGRDVEGLSAALRANPPDRASAGSHLKSMTDKLEFAGKAVTSVAGLVEPVKAIAVAVGLSLKALGFG